MQNHDRRWRSRATWVLVGFLLVAAYFLITEHKAHLSGLLYYLPFLLLLACPLLHLFMHGGHGNHGSGGGHRHSSSQEEADKPGGGDQHSSSRGREKNNE